MKPQVLLNVCRAVDVVGAKDRAGITYPYSRILSILWPVLNLEFSTVLPVPACASLALIFLD
jgi:hypothetical protein